MNTSVAPTAVDASDFERRCSELLETARQTGEEMLITRGGIPIARIVPVRHHGGSLRGLLRDEASIRGDIVHFDSTELWEAAR